MSRPYIPLGVTGQGRFVPTPLNEGSLDRAQRARECTGAPLGDLLLASGAVEGPFKRTHPITRWSRAAQRFTRKVLAFLLAPHCNL